MPARITWMLATMCLWLARAAGAAPLDDAGRACVNAMNAAGLAAAHAQAAETDRCLAGSPACVIDLGDDARKIAFDAAVASCAELPAFGIAPTVDEGVTD